MAHSRGGSGHVVVGYFQSWAVYRPSHGKFSVEDIDPSLCTHLIYAFAGLDENTNEIKSLNPDLDIAQGGYRNAVALKRRNPRLKVTLAVGGWNEGSPKYSSMAGSAHSRRMFVNSVVAFLSEYNFDGLDLDWEYPAQRGGTPGDKKNFVILCQELRRKFDRRGWLLTAAVAADKSKSDTAYDLPALARLLDYFHLMAYDYHGKWDGVLGHNAPLYSSGPYNVNYSVDHYLRGGVPASKLVLGLATYGKTFLARSNPSVGAPAQQEAFAGPYTNEDGNMGYNEIVEKLENESGQWSLGWDSAQKVPFMSSGKKWVSYDDVRSIKKKVSPAARHQRNPVMSCFGPGAVIRHRLLLFPLSQNLACYSHSSSKTTLATAHLPQDTTPPPNQVSTWHRA